MYSTKGNNNYGRPGTG